MSNIYGAETQLLGGGFGGWGGGFGGGIGSGFLGGILGGALFGGRGLFGRDGRDGHCGCGCNPCKCNADCHDVLELMEKLGDVDKDIFLSANGTQKDICSLKDNIASVNYNQAINTKDIIHDIDIQSCNLGSKIDKCCCETNHNIDNKFFGLSKQVSDCCCELQKEGLKNTQVILDRMCANEKATLLRELEEEKEKRRRMERESDLFRFGNVVAANFRATTNGSNFNTGTQTQSTSNNSGQIVG